MNVLWLIKLEFMNNTPPRKKKKKKKWKAEPKHFPFNTYFIKKSKEGFSKINSKY